MCPEATELLILDAAGKILSAHRLNFDQGEVQELELNQLPAGVYFLKMVAGNQFYVRRLVLER